MGWAARLLVVRVDSDKQCVVVRTRAAIYDSAGDDYSAMSRQRRRPLGDAQ